MNSTRFATLLRHDTRLQFRNGIYAAYAVVMVMYAAILLSLGQFLPDWLPALLIMTDPAVLGFFFLGALMMLEKAEGVRTGLAITPVSAAEYFWAKTIPLTLLAVGAVAIFGVLIHGGTNHVMLAGSTVLISICFLGVGVPTALYFKSVTSYLVGSATYLIPIMLPILLAFGDRMPAWAIILPTTAQMRLVLVATGAREATMLEVSAMFVVAAIAAAGTVWFAIKQLEKELGVK